MFFGDSTLQFIGSIEHAFWPVQPELMVVIKLKQILFSLILVS